MWSHIFKQIILPILLYSLWAKTPQQNNYENVCLDNFNEHYQISFGDKAVDWGWWQFEGPGYSVPGRLVALTRKKLEVSGEVSGPRIREQGESVSVKSKTPPLAEACPTPPRPPGHHAQHSLMDGYCMFNHVAVAARYAQKKHRIQRSVAWDRWQVGWWWARVG